MMSILFTPEGRSALTAAEHGRAAARLSQAMAAVIGARRKIFGRCSADDLARDGFTVAEIAVFGPGALRLEEARSAPGATGKTEASEAVMKAVRERAIRALSVAVQALACSATTTILIAFAWVLS